MNIEQLKGDIQLLYNELCKADYNEQMVGNPLNQNAPTDWEGLARKAYAIGSALLDRHIEPKIVTTLITGSLFKDEEPSCNAGIEGCNCGGCDCGC